MPPRYMIDKALPTDRHEDGRASGWLCRLFHNYLRRDEELGLKEKGSSLKLAGTNPLVPACYAFRPSDFGRLRKNVKASSADIVLLGTPSPGPKVNTLM